MLNKNRNSLFRRIILSITFALGLVISNAQSSDNIPISFTKQESYVTFDVFSSLNTFNPRWKIGYIKSLDSRWKMGLNLGYGNRAIAYIYFANHFEEDFRLWELRPEIYRVFKQYNRTLQYVSLELFYINHYDILRNSYYYKEDLGEVSYDRADYQRHKYGFNVNVGELTHLGKHFGINIFMGFGVRMRAVSFSDVVNPQQTETFIDMIDFGEYKKDEGLDLGLNYSIGLKLLLR